MVHESQLGGGGIAPFQEFSGSATQGFNYKKTNSYSTNRINSDGTTTPVSLTQYWMCVKTTNIDPEIDTTGSYIQVKPFSNYSASQTYEAYTNPSFNSCVKVGSDIWRVKFITLDGNDHPTSPEANKYWTAADVCNKSFAGCTRRFYANPAGDGLVFASNPLNENTLPYGGFPGSKDLG